MILSEITSPIVGPLKEPLLIMEWICFCLFFELGFIMIIRMRSKKTELKVFQERAFASIIFGYATMWMFIVIADYYVNTVELRLALLNTGRSFQCFGAFIFTFFLEKYRIFYKKYILTLSSLIILIIYTIVSIIAPTCSVYVSIGYWPFFIMFFVFYLKKFEELFKSETLSRIAKFEFFNFFVGILFIAVGYGLSTDIARILLGLEFRIIGDIVQLIAIVFCYIFILSLPSFSEYDWKEKLNQLIIMHRSGLLLFKKDFRRKDTIDLDPVVSGTLTQLKLLIEQLTMEKGTSIIEKEGKTIIIQPREFITGVLITDEKLISLKVLLNKLMDRIETVYMGILPEWDGDLKIFIPIESMVEKIFG